MSGAVVAAIDLGPDSARVLYHAAGFARLLSARLRVLHVCSAPTPAEHERVVEFCRQVQSPRPCSIPSGRSCLRFPVGRRMP